MKRNRCSLCGGKLVNHRCVECGLDNTQNDEHNNIRINQPQKTSVPNTKISTRKANGGILRKIAGGIVIGTILSAILGVIKIAPPNWFRPEHEEALDMEEGLYDYVSRELSEEGEYYDVVLEPGVYHVGVHIPEGTYHVSIPEEDEEYGGVFFLQDVENHIFMTQIFGDYEGEIQAMEDLRLYDGAFLEIQMGLKLKLSSDNAQIDRMHGVPNPLQVVDPLMGAVVLDGSAKAGVDFPAGVYDISISQEDQRLENEGTVDCIVPFGDTEEEDLVFSYYFDGYPGRVICNNVVLPEGTLLEIDGLEKIELSPCNIIVTADYDHYYMNYR